MKVGRIKDPLYKDSYFGIIPPTFIPPFEAPELYRFKLYFTGLGLRFGVLRIAFYYWRWGNRV